MIVTCEKCKARFKLDEAKLGSLGAKVRCSKCQHSFVVRPPGGIGADIDSGLTKQAKSGDTIDLPPSAGVPSPDEQSLAAKSSNSNGQLIDGSGGKAPGQMASPQSPLALPKTPELPAIPEFEAPSDAGNRDNQPAGVQAPAFFDDSPTTTDVNPLSAPRPEGVETAVYVVPESIRNKAKRSTDERLVVKNNIPKSGQAKKIAGSKKEPDKRNSDGSYLLDTTRDATGTIPVHVLAAVRAQSAANVARSDPEVPLNPFEEKPIGAELSQNQAPGSLDDLPPDEGPLFVDDADIVSVSEASNESIEQSDPFQPGADPAFSYDGSLSADGTFIAPVVGAAPEDLHPSFDETRDIGAAIRNLQDASLDPASVTAAGQLKVKAVQGKSFRTVLRVLSAAAISVVVIVLVIFGILVYLNEGRIEPYGLKRTAINLTKKFGAAKAKVEINPVEVRSVLYPNRLGQDELVFMGKVENRSTALRHDLQVVAELHDAAGNRVAQAIGPLGLNLDPADLYGVTNQAELTVLYERHRAHQPLKPIAPGATLPFTVVVLDPPEAVAELTHSVRVEQAPPVVSKVDLEPKTAPEPTEPELEAVTSGEELDKFGKLKAKRRKNLKRKAKITEE